ncbi:Stp1/IreP family PP2C-type Ser/Thr phosphatase [Isobaculum melis]|uniref:protein-serine/threonine phosphatase n=1 Tax=Isobaculum melis TaxID=142588 RepID=A0A1H9RAR8_9LACT|nr:Stp1/IreP family PP2C-type Ser/Thr phosphatase [Isobaculum melis]SER69635.1 protein phosphatase [Isobaculum melis]
MQITFSTNVGRQRTNNEDYTGIYYNQAGVPIAMVADGMGGHQAGDVASESVVSSIGKKWEQGHYTTSDETIPWLKEHIQLANAELLDKATRFPQYQGMGTTLVVAILFETQFLIANIGDSRGYLMGKGYYEQLTEDHSLVNELVKRGEITADEALHHPRKNILTRSMGNSAPVDIDLWEIELPSEATLLLCSDGLTNMVSDDEIKTILSEPNQTLDQKATQLIEQANKNGGNDNITVLLVVFPVRKEV